MLKIKETREELKRLLKKEKDVRKRERIEVLYWLKTGQVKNMVMAANQIGRSYWTVKRWLRSYSAGGLEKLMERRHGGGNKLTIPKEILEELDKRLKRREGFSSYGAIQAWLLKEYALEIKYKTLHKIVHNRLGASPKVVRPQSAAQDESKVSDFEKKKH